MESQEIGLSIPPLGGTSGLNSLLNRTFVSTSVSVGGTPKKLVPSTEIVLSISDEGITASAGCNSFFGGVDVEPGRLLVGVLSSTLIGCSPDREEQDNWLSAVLAAGPSWRFTGITLTSGDVQIVLTEQS